MQPNREVERRRTRNQPPLQASTCALILICLPATTEPCIPYSTCKHHRSAHAPAADAPPGELSERPFQLFAAARHRPQLCASPWRPRGTSASGPMFQRAFFAAAGAHFGSSRLEMHPSGVPWPCVASLRAAAGCLLAAVSPARPRQAASSWTACHPLLQEPLWHHDAAPCWPCWPWRCCCAPRPCALPTGESRFPCSPAHVGDRGGRR